MKINKEELSRFKTNVIYTTGYRIVYYYEEYHEVPQGLYAKNLEDFANFFTNNKQYVSVKDVLEKFLEENKTALGVAIYDVNQNCIDKLVRPKVNKINDSEVYKEELIYDMNYVTVKTGYRIVYIFKDGSYKIGMYAETIEEFMKEFAPYEPIDEFCEIPKFISVDDLLNRYLEDCPDITGIVLYNVDGSIVEQKNRELYNAK